MSRSAPSLGLLAVLALAACGADARAPSESSLSAEMAAIGARSLSAQVQRDLAALRRATAAFQQHERARQAGYDEQFPPGCMESGEGGQGYHYLKGGLVGTLDATEPQLLMYEPQANGRLDLVGVEYIFPGDPEDAPPRLFGRDFVYSELYGVWLLHVWVWRGNPHPEGIFANWNPLVSCRHAAARAAAGARHH